MKKYIYLSISLFLGGYACSYRAGDTAVTSHNNQYIDPTIGNVGQLLVPTRPTVQLPNQFIRMYPIRNDGLDDQIASFPLTIVSHRLGEAFALKPMAGNASAEQWDRKMPYDHDLEITRPWYYSTWLVNDDITVEFTPGEKTGFYRFTFANGQPRTLLFNTYNDGEAMYRFLSGTEIVATETYHGDIKIYMYGVFDQPGTEGVNRDGQLKNDSAVFGRSARSYITFAPGNAPIGFKYAISFVSMAQARKNFEQEIRHKDFSTVKNDAEAAWSRITAQIEVEGGTEAQKRSFYTALYRSHERMVNISEDSLYYSGFNKQINKDPRPFYVDDWSWDTYLALHPLRTILHPAQEEDMLQSYVRMYEQSSWMPTFPVLFGDHACMNGFHSTIMFLDAYKKGLKNVDWQKAYEGIRKNALEGTLIPWQNGNKTILDDYYHTNGYFPALHPGEKETVPQVNAFEKRQAVAVTLGASFDDWAAGELAKALKKDSDIQLLTNRGMNYKQLWDPGKQFFLPKDNKGAWINIDPAFDGGIGGRDYYDENNGWTYLWQVQQDIPGLIALMGGKQAFEQRLDQLFREGLGRSKYEFWNKFPDATGLVGQFSMGNEPGFHIPYLYNYAGAPWKTQKAVRFLLDTWFKDNIFGIPGDEDGGGMSAFVVFSSMGFYPVTPGLPLYTIGSPVFSKVSIKLDNGRHFTISAPNSSVVNKYIQKATMNGKELLTPWFTHQQLIEGGTLELEMGPKPNKTWGTDLNLANRP